MAKKAKIQAKMDVDESNSEEEVDNNENDIFMKSDSISQNK